MRFNGIPAPVLSISAEQVVVQAPFALTASDTVKVEVESSLAPESVFTLPYEPEAAVTLQLCACARETARASAITAPIRRAAAGRSEDAIPARRSERAVMLRLMGYLPEPIELTASIGPVSPWAEIEIAPLEAMPLAGAVHSMRDFPMPPPDPAGRRR